MAKLNRDDAEQIVKRDMPGWKVVEVPTSAVPTDSAGAAVDAESPDLLAHALRRLGDGQEHDVRGMAPVPAADAAAPATTIVVVEPAGKSATDSRNPAYAAKRVVIGADGKVKGTQG